MQLGLGQAADEVLDFRYKFSLKAPAVRLVHFDRRGLLVDERDVPLFARLIEGGGAAAPAGVIDFLFVADGHLGLKLVHSRNDLMRVDGGPDVLWPVVVDGVGIAEKKGEMAEILCLV